MQMGGKVVLEWVQEKEEEEYFEFRTSLLLGQIVFVRQHIDWVRIPFSLPHLNPELSPLPVAPISSSVTGFYYF